MCWQRLMAASLGFLLSTCGGQASPEKDIAPVAALVVIPTATATAAPPTATRPVEATIAPAADMPLPRPTFTATPSPEPTATPTPADWLNNVGRTGDNLVYLGNPEAPITLIDYSDFL